MKAFESNAMNVGSLYQLSITCDYLIVTLLTICPIQSGSQSSNFLLLLQFLTLVMIFFEKKRYMCSFNFRHFNPESLTFNKKTSVLT